jgi:DNA-binding NarL/FixJ family response regulator
MSPITVVVADEERERRAMCLRVLERDKSIRVVGEAENAVETLDSARLSPRVLLVDSKLATGRGRVLRWYRMNSPETKVIVIASHSSQAALMEAFSHGAHGYLSRRLLRALLPKAVHKVDEGESWVPRKMLPRIIETLMHLAAENPQNAYR